MLPPIGGNGRVKIQSSVKACATATSPAASATGRPGRRPSRTLAICHGEQSTTFTNFGAGIGSGLSDFRPIRRDLPAPPSRHRWSPPFHRPECRRHRLEPVPPPPPFGPCRPCCAGRAHGQRWLLCASAAASLAMVSEVVRRGLRAHRDRLVIVPQSRAHSPPPFGRSVSVLCVRGFVRIEIGLRCRRRDLRIRRCISGSLVSATAAAVRRRFVGCQFGAHGVCRGLRSFTNLTRIYGG